MPRLIELLPEPVAETLRAWRAKLRDRRDWSAYQRHPQVPPPHVVKFRAILDHARRFGLRVLIETGTFEGEMPRKCRTMFERIHTIELDPGYARRAIHRLRHHRNIEVIEGDSTVRLPELLMRVHEPALFWLDGHYSAGLTARGEKDTPLLEEIDAIARHGVLGHVILVDDARCLGDGDYPTLATLEQRLRAVPGIEQVEVADDIVRATPRARGGA
jgi:hypothetical protein